MFIYIHKTSFADASTAAENVTKSGHIPLGPAVWGSMDFNLELKALAYCDGALLEDPETGYETTQIYKLRSLEEECNRLGVPIGWGNDFAPHPVETNSPDASTMFREELGRMYRMFLKKNRDYSPANISGTGELGVIVRLWDKMARLMSLSGFNLQVELLSYLPNGQPPQYESITDTLEDMAVYSLLLRILKAGKWGK